MILFLASFSLFCHEIFMILHVNSISWHTCLSQLINHLHMIATDFMNIQKLLYISISRLVVILSGLWTCRSSKLADHSWAFQAVQLNCYIEILFSVIFNLQLLFYYSPVLWSSQYDSSLTRFGLHLTACLNQHAISNHCSAVHNTMSSTMPPFTMLLSTMSFSIIREPYPLGIQICKISLFTPFRNTTLMHCHIYPPLPVPLRYCDQSIPPPPLASLREYQERK